MPLFSFIDTSGLTPLKLPPSLSNQPYPADGVPSRPAPSSESIARFQAAMGEQPPAPLADTAPAPSAPIIAAQPDYGQGAPIRPSAPLPGKPPVQASPAPLAPQEPVVAVMPTRKPVPVANAAPVTAAPTPVTPPVTEPAHNQDAPIRPNAPLPGEPPVRIPPAPLAPQGPVVVVAPTRKPIVAVVDAPPVPSAPIAAPKPSRRQEIPILTTGSPSPGESPIPQSPAPQSPVPLATQKPVVAVTPTQEPVVAVVDAPPVPSAPIAAPEPSRKQEAPVLTTAAPLSDEPPVQGSSVPLAPQEPVVAVTPPRDPVSATRATPVVAAAPTLVTEPPHGQDVLVQPSDVPAIPANPPAGGGQPVVDLQRPTDDIQLAKVPAAVEKPETDNQIDDEPNTAIPQLQAAPVAAAFVPTDAAPVAVDAPVAIEIDPAAATARTHELVEAATQVADTILVTPSLIHGEGEISIQLKPTVLDGSQIRLEAKGSTIAVAITPATPAAAQAIAQAKDQFEQTLAERIPSFQIAVSVENLNFKTDRRKNQTV